MTLAEREKLISRIVAGVIPLRLPLAYFVRPANRELRLEAEGVYEEALENAQHEGLMTEGQLLSFLRSYDLWDDKKDKLLTALPKEIEQFKVGLFQNTFRSNERLRLRECISLARAKLVEVYSQRHAYDHVTDAGLASLAKNKFLFRKTTFSKGGKLIRLRLVENGMAALSQAKLSESVFRELARTEPWQTIWGCRAAEGGLFGMASVDYTEEQRNLVGWSTFYGQVREHPECPSEDVLIDDDMFDGWVILQKRARDARQGQKTNLPAGDEIYIPVDTPEDAARLDSMNDAQNAAIKQQRWKVIAERGEVNEVDLPDVKRDLQLARNRAGFN